MNAPVLTIDTNAISQNWQQLNALSSGKAAAVVKANGYGLGIDITVKSLLKSGTNTFFVATVAEAIHAAKLAPDATIYELSGFSCFETSIPKNLQPVINSHEQLKANSHENFALQFDTGMSRVGFDLDQISSLNSLNPTLVMSHLACADEPDHPMNISQINRFMGVQSAFPNTPTSLSATGGILAGSKYHFDMTRPGIGIYGGAPFMDAKPTIQINLPVINIRDIPKGTHIGYGGTFTATKPMRIATVLGGYADGISRALSNSANLFANGTPCAILGRISMDAITVDITHLTTIPTSLDALGPDQDINDLAKAAGTISYELFTGLGSRYDRQIKSSI